MSPVQLLTELLTGLLLFNYCYGGGPGSSSDRKKRSHDARGPSQDQGYNTVAEPKEVLCYRCVYDVREGQIGGDLNCQDSLKGKSAGEESCVGSCYKKYMALGSDNFSYSRGCMRNCQSHSGKSSYTKCCSSPLCNGGNSASRLLLPRAIYAVFFSTLISLLTGFYRWQVL